MRMEKDEEEDRTILEAAAGQSESQKQYLEACSACTKYVHTYRCWLPPLNKYDYLDLPRGKVQTLKRNKWDHLTAGWSNDTHLHRVSGDVFQKHWFNLMCMENCSCERKKRKGAFEHTTRRKKTYFTHEKGHRFGSLRSLSRSSLQTMSQHHWRVYTPSRPKHKYSLLQLVTSTLITFKDSPILEHAR